MAAHHHIRHRRAPDDVAQRRLRGQRHDEATVLTRAGGGGQVVVEVVEVRGDDERLDSAPPRAAQLSTPSLTASGGPQPSPNVSRETPCCGKTFRRLTSTLSAPPSNQDRHEHVRASPQAELIPSGRFTRRADLTSVNLGLTETSGFPSVSHETSNHDEPFDSSCQRPCRCPLSMPSSGSQCFTWNTPEGAAGRER